MSSISSRIQFLLTFVKIPPEAWDFFFPHGPNFSKAIVEYMMAGVVRDIAQQISNKELPGRANKVGRQIVDFAAGNLVNGWEDGEDICPPWPHFPFPHPHPFPEPDPYPWITNRFAELNPQPLPPSQIASALKVLSGITSIKEVVNQLNELSSQLRTRHSSYG